MKMQTLVFLGTGLAILALHVSVVAQSDDIGPIPAPPDGGSYDRAGNSTAQANIPAFDFGVHSTGNIVLPIWNTGQFGYSTTGNAWTDPVTSLAVYGLTFPKGSGLLYEIGGSLAVGGIRGMDTCVSLWEFAPDFAPFGRFRYESLDVTKPYYSENAHSTLDLVCEYYDTLTDRNLIGVDPDGLGPHRPLNLKVKQRSMSWGGGRIGEFVIIHYSVELMGDERINDIFIGFQMGSDIFHYEALYDLEHWRSLSYAGFLHEWPVHPECEEEEDVEIAYIMTTDGAPLDGSYDHMSPLGACGIAVLGMPNDTCRLNYNWRTYSEDLGGMCWHPQKKSLDGSRLRDLSNSCSPVRMGDLNMYYIMSRRAFDYDQMTIALNRTNSGWNAPPSDANYIASIGEMSRSYLSFGPIDLGPGQTAEFTIAVVAGDSVHTDPTAHARLFNPQDPWPFYNQLDFSNLAENTMWARWVYDNPGIDSDGDGYFGRYRMCNGDTVWYEGDGVPDFRADVPPPAPDVRIIPTVGKLTIRWNGYVSETNIDPFTRTQDFEGYRVYAGLDKRKSVMTVLSSYDRHNYNRFIYRQITETRAEWRNSELPFTLDSLRLLYDDPGFEPLLYTRVDPLVYNDSFFYFEQQDYNQYNLSNPDEIHKAYPNAPYPGTDSLGWTESDITMEHGRPLPKYWEYEYVYDKLLSTIPYFVAVTAFDFGFAKGGIPAKESSILDAQIESYAQMSSDTVSEYGLDAYVYPNPWRSDANYRARGLENRDQMQIPNRSRRIHFANLPAVCKISIFSLDGDLVREIDHDFPSDSPEAMHDEWDMVTRNHMLTQSGMYYYAIESATRTQVGTFVIIM